MAICWAITAFVGFWVALGLVLAAERGPYVRLAVILVAINLGLLGMRALLRRR